MVHIKRKKKIWLRPYWSIAGGTDVDMAPAHFGMLALIHLPSAKLKVNV